MVRELGLTKVDHRLTLTQKPVSYASATRSRTVVGETKVKGTKTLKAKGRSLRIDAVLRPGSSTETGLDVRVGGDQRTQVGYDSKDKVLYVDRTRSGDASFSPTFAARHTAPLDLHGKPLELTIFVDSSSVEVFAQDGKVSISDLVYPDRSSTGIQVYADGGTARLTRAKIATIGSTIRR